MAELQFFNVQLTAKRIIAKDILELRFEKPPGFGHEPGQFVQFKVADGEKFVLRSYSISSTPKDSYLEFCVKILPGGKASSFFSSLREGESARISPPRGMFVCKDEHSLCKIFIATGTGLAPVVSMIESMVHEYRLAKNALEATPVAPNAAETTDQPKIGLPKERIKLLFGVRTEEDIFWADRLDNAQNISSIFSYDITLSRPDGSWNGRRGRVTEYVPIDTSADYYICGSLEMVKDVRKILLDGGVNTKSVHFEIF